MGLLNLFRRKPVETRSSSSYTAQAMAVRDSYISGRRGLAELTATAQGCVSLWENAFALAQVKGTRFLDRRTMALIARSCATRGEALLMITSDGLTPATDWDVSTRGGRPRAYRLSLPESGGARSVTALAAEVLHLVIGADMMTPWIGTAPLRRSSLTAAMLHAVEAALAETFENAPVGSQIVHLPDSAAEDMEAMRSAFRGRRGATLIVEGVAQATAAGMNPQLGQRPDQLSPDLEKAMTAETLAAAREAVMFAFGIPPGLASATAAGPGIREAQRHLATWTLQPLAELLAEEATEKLGAAVAVDVLTPLQAFDAGGSARALSTIIGAMVQAKEGGLTSEEMAAALAMVDWKQD